MIQSQCWFFGLKLHLVINHLGELIALKITSGKQNDAKANERRPVSHYTIKLFRERLAKFEKEDSSRKAILLNKQLFLGKRKPKTTNANNMAPEKKQKTLKQVTFR